MVAGSPDGRPSARRTAGGADSLEPVVVDLDDLYRGELLVPASTTVPGVVGEAVVSRVSATPW